MDLDFFLPKHRPLTHRPVRRSLGEGGNTSSVPFSPATPFSPASGPATGSFNGLHAKSKFLAINPSRQKQIPSNIPSNNAALESIEKAIDAQKLRYFRERRSKDPTLWRKEAATVTIQNPDDTMVELWAVKGEILEKLGRSDEAAQMRQRTAEPGRPDDPSPYKSVHERLKDWFKQHRMETPK